ncbi:HesB/YadR/YfhF family protein [Mammaliicoccus sp. Dog046]|uniref:HesB/YadR/YfhF family protein n=1 Tax=Mammaliicoccus sp. Dog046 TaxID=3034233 RepID=UPI002B258239|nr:HesB/YadR/YfhF family protein [Mammaliicoccus sp. Dog046]WQK84444.1 HesB/YadR/YfhF family protein [Mammaliicoccus sp. Dog046]
MNLEITDKAMNWFKNELDFTDDQALRFFVRYGGEFQLKQGFSPAFTVEPLSTSEIGFKDEKDDIPFFIDEKDLWYFEGNDLVIDLNDNDEIKYVARTSN